MLCSNSVATLRLAFQSKILEFGAAFAGARRDRLRHGIEMGISGTLGSPRRWAWAIQACQHLWPLRAWAAFAAKHRLA